MTHDMKEGIRHIHRALFAVLLALLPIQLGYHLWPSWAMILGRRIDYLSPTFYVTDVVVFIMLFLWFAEFFAAGTQDVLRKRDKRPAHMQPWLLHVRDKSMAAMYPLLPDVKYILLFAVFAVLNVRFAKSPPAAAYGWIKSVEFFLLGLYIVRTRPAFSAVLPAFAAGVWYTALFAIWQVALQHSVGGFAWWLGERAFGLDTPGIARLSWCIFPARLGCRELLRAYATFPHPNVLGGYVAVILPLIIGAFLTKRLTAHEKYVYGGACIAGCMALIFSFSRSAWLVSGLGIGMTHYVVWKIRRKRPENYSHPRHIFFALLCVFFVGLAMLYRPGSTDESVVQRSALNEAAFYMWRRAPLWGVGMRNFLVVLPETSSFAHNNIIQPVHNMYVLVLAEIGIAGAFLSAVAARRIWIRLRCLPAKNKTSPWSVFYLVSCIAILFLGLVDHYFVSLQQGQLLCVVMFSLYCAELSAGRLRHGRFSVGNARDISS